MIRILLVDDDVRAIEGIAQNMDWNALGVDEFYLAYSAHQAQAVFEKTDIDILLSDIEMPKYNGLELLEWVNDHKENVVCIFLTSYANFSYANTALRLGSVDYLLKPVPYPELAAAIGKAVKKVEHLRLQSLDAQQAGYWNDNRATVEEHFWHDVACGVILQNARAIAEQAQRKHVEYSGLPVRPLFFELSACVNDIWEPGLLETALFNILREMFCGDSALPIILRMERNGYIVLVDCGISAERLCAIASEAVNICEALFSRAIKCCIGKAVAPDMLYEEASALMETSRSGSDPASHIITIRSKRAEHFSTDVVNWLGGLARGNYNEVLSAIRESLTANPPDRNQLAQLYQSFTWGIYPVMEQNGLTPHNIMSDKQIVHIASQAVQTLSGLLRWIECIIQQLADAAPDDGENALKQAKKYILKHLAEDLTRADIAAAVYLSPDYLSHMFKAQTGSSLSDYIIEQRMEKAKKLLSTTRMPIHKIATEVGYNNIPYFSKLFKRLTGRTPNAYRKHPE